RFVAAKILLIEREGERLRDDFGANSFAGDDFLCFQGCFIGLPGYSPGLPPSFDFVLCLNSGTRGPAPAVSISLRTLPINRRRRRVRNEAFCARAVSS